MERTLRFAGLVALILACRAGAQEPEKRVTVEAPAVVLPSRDVGISSEVAGVIKRVVVDEGDRVAAGQPLVELEAELQELALAASEVRARSAETRVRAADAMREFRREEYERKRKLAAGAQAPEAEMKQAELEVRQAEALREAALLDLELQRIEVRRNQLILARMTVRAPFDGVVARRYRDAGESIREGQPVVRLVVLGELQVSAFVPLADAPRIRPGMTAELRLDGPPDVRLPCRVVAIDPLADPATSTRRVRLELRNPEGQLMAGSKGKVLIEVGRAGPE